MDTLIESYKHFFFLIYSSNPMRDNVRMYVDGDPGLIIMRREAFVNLVIETVGHQITAAVQETLNTYGTFWVLDRENSRVFRAAITSTDDVRNLREIMNRDHAYDTPEKRRAREEETINPAEDLAYAEMDLPFFQDPDEDQDSSRTRRRGISIIPFRSKKR